MALKWSLLVDRKPSFCSKEVTRYLFNISGLPVNQLANKLVLSGTESMIILRAMDREKDQFLEERVAVEIMQYVRHGYLEGVQKLIKNIKKQTWFIRFLQKAVKHEYLEIASFLLGAYPKMFSTEIIQAVFCEANNIHVAKYFLEKKREDITPYTIGTTIENIIEKHQHEDTSSQLEVVSFLLREPLPDYILDRIFFFAVKQASKEVVKIFVEKKSQFILKNTDVIFPMIARIGGVEEGLDFLLKEKGKDIGSQVIIEAFFEILSQRIEDVKTFDFLIKNRPDALSVMSVEQITRFLLLALKEMHLSILDIFFEEGEKCSVDFISVFLHAVKNKDMEIIRVLLSRSPGMVEKISFDNSENIFLGSLKHDDSTPRSHRS